MFDNNTNSFPKYNDSFATPFTKKDKHIITLIHLLECKSFIAGLEKIKYNVKSSFLITK